jgi:hypothetical protein
MEKRHLCLVSSLKTAKPIMEKIAAKGAVIWGRVERERVLDVLRAVNIWRITDL